jgi:U3 small nucleolar RNA-associated protein 18
MLPSLPVYSAKFIMDGKQLLMTGNRKHFYYYDLEANKLEKVPGIQGGVFANTNEALGENLSRVAIGPAGSDYIGIAGGETGAIAILSQKTKKLIFELKLSSSSCAAVGFGTGHNVYAVGDQAEIYVWDTRYAKRCLAKIGDEGSFNTTHLTLS